ncbi:helix-turn-helix transcriptional regulator [Kitasatospora purpeofusca]|uniref:helix-turn-helix transcriptional regulator n=1 Tax=Kitasatospora purpeofusca TaxID=67352 RepID=UPI0039A455EB
MRVRRRDLHKEQMGHGRCWQWLTASHHDHLPSSPRPTAIGRIRAIREARGYTQEGLAHAAGVHRHTVYRAELGTHGIGIDGLLLARTLKDPQRASSLPSRPWPTLRRASARESSPDGQQQHAHHHDGCDQDPRSGRQPRRVRLCRGAVLHQRYRGSQVFDEVPPRPRAAVDASTHLGAGHVRRGHRLAAGQTLRMPGHDRSTPGSRHGRPLC